MPSKYSFEIVYKKYTIGNLTLESIRGIRVSGITIVSKNTKFTTPFNNPKYVRKIHGGFKKIAGTNSYPILIPSSEEVRLFIENFPFYPVFDFSNDVTDFRKDFFLSNGIIQIVNIKKKL